MSITHNKIASDQNKVNDDDWNENHVLTNIIDLELVETKSVSAQSSVTFSDLNGNNSVLFLIYVNGSIASGGDLLLKPNNSSSNLKCFSSLHYCTSTYAWCSTDGTVIRNDHAAAGTLIGIIKLYPKTGVPRQMLIDGGFTKADLSNGDRQTGHQIWNNTADNITSLVVAVASGTFTGEISLYKSNIPI